MVSEEYRYLLSYLDYNLACSTMLCTVLWYDMIKNLILYDKIVECCNISPRPLVDN
jgi:hypothetical protein